MNSRSLKSTPSPRALLGKTLNSFEKSVAPATTCNAVSTTSSARARPFGKPDLATAVLRRSCSEGVTFLGWLTPGMPVKKIVARSSRPPKPRPAFTVVGTLTPGYKTGISLPSSGSSTPLANWRSLSGDELLKRSLAPIGTTTSLTSGCPRRATCFQVSGAPAAPGTRRDVVDQIPMTGSPLVSREDGTCSTIEWTLKPAR